MTIVLASCLLVSNVFKYYHTNLEWNHIAEHLFHQAGLSRSITYSDARSAKQEDVAEILFHSYLPAYYVVVEDSEGLLQVSWKKETHWKAGSTPEGRPREAPTRYIMMQPPIGTARPQKVCSFLHEYQNSVVIRELDPICTWTYSLEIKLTRRKEVMANTNVA